MDTEAFKVTEVDGLRLIMPHHSTAGSNDAWERDNLWLRSRVECVKTGDTISQGLGKFFNLGQGPDGIRVDVIDILDAIHLSSCARKPIRFGVPEYLGCPKSSKRHEK